MGGEGAEALLERTRPEALTGTFRIVSFPPTPGLLRFGQSLGSPGPMLRGYGLPGCGWGCSPLWLLSSPFQSSAPPLERHLGTQRKGVVTTAHLRWMCDRPSGGHPSPGTAAPTRHGSRDSARFVYKPVYPSIYMLHRMYICWEHARFSRVSPPPCVVRLSARGPCREGGSGDARLPHAATTGPSQSPPVRLPVCPCPQLCPRFDRPDAAPRRGRPSNFLYI